MPEEATRQLGLGILQRVAIREKARLQAHFLSRLYASPESDTIVLCGSMALHGVYLHGRWSKDLDFEAPLEIAQRFPEIAATCGLLVKPKEPPEGKPPSKTTFGFTFSLASAFYPDVAIAVEIFSRGQAAVRPERHTFCVAVKEQSPVYAKPLAVIIGVKIGCIFLRRKPVDFVDTWMGLKSGPDVRLQVRQSMREGLCGAGSFTPPAYIDAKLALLLLQELRPEWEEKLGVYMTQIPPFEQVYDDLAEWLPFFAETER